ncbi:hypothetical protein LTR91_011269 [Friedmanniomyces endolithicus]|uniref:Uncharacterized protein n=3 Tax=Friedmanniomyces endolithicus TaxID=329885 RepID=A0AAN6KIL2_9PEZI|nr:hypothetical protein LTR91_011269 [Friedmanniomyces endolithicus]KAK1029701.1 hypothetical protein LTS16_019475 [Friedmanniomyces endolithicus]
MATPDNAVLVPLDPASMPFIISSDGGQADAATRKFIRSHARRGRKESRTRPKRNVLVSGYGMAAGSVQVPSVNLEDIMGIYMPPMRRIGTDLSFLACPEDLDSSILSNIIKVSPIAERIVYPLITAVGNQVDNRDWIRLCTTDAAALQVTAFSVEGFVDIFLRRRDHPSPTAMVHLQNGLVLLSERLAGDDEELKSSDASIGVVLKLATSAHFAGDLQAERQHMLGVRKMVDSRGGLDAFRDNSLLFEMLRRDLLYAVFSASKPVFFHHPLEPIPAYPVRLLPEFNGTAHTRDTAEVGEVIDADLAEAWGVMRRFGLLVSLGAQTQRLISTKVINETMTSVLYRLLCMRYASGSSDEGVRVVLLTYCYHGFLQWGDIKLPCPHLQNAFKEGILALQRSGEVSARFMLWVLMVGAVSIFDEQKEAWLNAMLSQHARRQQRSWREVQDILKSFLWIPLLDEKRGRSIWDSLD